MKIEFAKSLFGHDKNQIYFVIKREENFAWLVNGTTHTLEKPKKKNKKHFQIIKIVPENVEKRLLEQTMLTDDIIRQAVKLYIKSITK